MTPIEHSEVMIDLETLSTESNACILSIGAARFFPRSTGIMDHFEVFIDPASCTAKGLVIDADTVMWWMHGDQDAARKELMACPRLPLRTALLMFMEWLKGDRPVWGDGATFDNVILRNAYKAAGLGVPWSYWNDRCYRTMKSQYPDVKMVRKGTHHSAAADAVSQAVHLQAIFKSISGDE
jgi:exodeoxyribonuclease VIII